MENNLREPVELADCELYEVAGGNGGGGCGCDELNIEVELEVEVSL